MVHLCYLRLDGKSRTSGVPRIFEILTNAYSTLTELYNSLLSKDLPAFLHSCVFDSSQGINTQERTTIE